MRSPKMSNVGTVLVCAALLLGCSKATLETETASTREQGVVIRVIDGDTIELADSRRVRLLGIDTPERGECGWSEATDALAGLVQGHKVDLVRGGGESQDRYGRELAYLEVGSVDVGAVLLERGLAVARYDSRDGYGAHPREKTYIATDEAVPSVC